MNSLQDIEEGQTISIDTEAFSGVTFEVLDIEVEDIGITETFAVTLLSDSQSVGEYVIVGTTSDSAVTVEAVHGDTEEQVFWKQITAES